MTDAVYWVWLQSCFGVGRRFLPVIEYFGGVKQLYDSNYLQRKVCPDIKDTLLEKMETTTLDSAQKIIDKCRHEGWDIITFEDSRYPAKLKNIYAPPAVLYVWGEFPDFDNNLSLGVVGTRKASPYALKVARVISKGVAGCGGIIVSGMAMGIDSSAHRGAIDSGGITVGVMGCGFDTLGLAGDYQLRNSVIQNGALVTEFQPQVTASRFTFPPRNRIISGLTDGVFVVEAGIKSGSLITAEYATAQNRDLFAVPASIFDERFSGTNKLIDDGAMVVTSPSTILSVYQSKYKSLDLSKNASVRELLSNDYSQNKIPDDTEKQLSFDNIKIHRDNLNEMNEKFFALSENEKTVYKILGEEFMDVDSISRIASMEIKTVLMTLTMLELNGLAEAGMGKRYRRKQP